MFEQFKNIISEFFKTKNHKFIENHFDFLLKENFSKEFINYGIEKTLVYTKENIEFSITWEPQNRPGFFHFKINEKEILFDNVFIELQKQCPLMTESNPRINYWIWYKMDYHQYLTAYSNEIKKYLK